MRAWSNDSHEAAKPFSYGVTTLPVFDRNLKSLAEKVHYPAQDHQGVWDLLDREAMTFQQMPHEPIARAKLPLMGIAHIGRTIDGDGPWNHMMVPAPEPVHSFVLMRVNRNDHVQIDTPKQHHHQTHSAQQAILAYGAPWRLTSRGAPRRPTHRPPL